MSLLQEALKHPVQRKNADENVSDELLELAVAYARHEVTGKQVAKVLGIKEHNANHKMTTALASGVRSGRLVLKA